MAVRDQLYDIFKHWANLGKIWIISDLHFGESLEECGFDWKPSDDDIVRNINKCVTKNDTLIVLGDVGNVKYVKKLKGNKVLITGNHDAGRTKYLRQESFMKVPKGMTIEDAKKSFPDFVCFMKEFENTIYIDNKLFDEVYDGPLFINNKLILSHEPIIDTNGCFYNIHGHVHNDKIIKTDYSFNVCADAIHFMPMDLGNFLKSGALNKIKDIHRYTIDKAIERKQDADN